MEESEVHLQRPTTSQIWQVHPGDWVLTEQRGAMFILLCRTPNEIEAQNALKEYERQGRSVTVLQVKGTIP